MQTISNLPLKGKTKLFYQSEHVLIEYYTNLEMHGDAQIFTFKRSISLTQRSENTPF